MDTKEIKIHGTDYSISKIIIPDFPRKYVYFEKQSNDKLCGLHCLNSLLQFPKFDPISLAEIAQQLDELERQLYKEDPESSHNIKPIGNVDDDGNYNIQVLSEALRTLNTEIVALKQHECEKLLNESMDTVEAFIFNSSTHWFAIRKICNVWFNLNSTNQYPGPQIISDFYLSAFIKGTDELGYSNFLVKNLPPLMEIDANCYQDLLPHQKLVPVDDIVKNKPKKINMGDSDEHALEKAIELSKLEYEKSFSANDLNCDNNFGSFDDHREYPNINAQYTQYNQFNQYQINSYEQTIIEQDELNAVMEMSMNEYLEDIKRNMPKEPEEGSECMKLNFRQNWKIGPSAFNRNFNSTDKIGDVKNYVKIIFRTYGSVRLTGIHNNKLYVDGEQSLKEAGLSSDDTLIVNIDE